MSFEQFQLPPQLVKALTDLNFITPTPIQEKAIPIGLTGKDIMGMAQTGTGKTAAFGIPIVERLLKNPRENALILAPTRELAVQIHDFMRSLTRQTPHISSALLIGGLSMRMQNKSLSQRPRIIIATPGRLTDHLNSKAQLLSHTVMLVLDEADRMLDMGFAPQLQKIRKFLPRERQTFMFSATFPKNIKQLANEYLKDPVEVSAGEVSRPVLKIKQEVVETTVKDKNNKLVDELTKREGSVLIFARTKSRTDRLTKFLHDSGFQVTKIHGDCSQAQRQKSIDSFRAGRIRILVATDIASRGIDVPDIGHVINYDLPQAPEDYVHRIGRTGRNGKEGHALCLLTPEDRNAWRFIARAAGVGGAAGAHGASGNGAPEKYQRPQRSQRPQQRQANGYRGGGGGGARSNDGENSGRPNKPRRSSNFRFKNRTARSAGGDGAGTGSSSGSGGGSRQSSGGGRAATGRW
jgi:superfamily II DNA/RNA helicase